jgi:SAM-dependent methyltransferase
METGPTPISEPAPSSEPVAVAPRSQRVGRARPVDHRRWLLPFVREISDRDEMVATATPRQYYHLGFAALDSIDRALRAADFGRSPKTVLDFACGHGRVLRMLVAAFPEADFTACDLNRDGVEFCRRIFGATPVLGHELAEQMQLPDRYELIWVGSLFTHLDAPRWNSFLALLAQHLEPGGVLVFTTHGRGSIEELRVGERSFSIDDAAELLSSCDRDGFGYQNYVGHDNFGISLSRPWWVCSELERHQALELVCYTEGGWNGRQDVVACRAL